MSMQTVIGLNGVGFYVGSILEGLEEIGPDLVDLTCVVLTPQNENGQKLDELIGRVLDEAAQINALLQPTGEVFAVRVNINADNKRRFTWLPSDICAERKKTVQKLLANHGTFC